MNDILQQIMNMIENTRTVPSISSFSMNSRIAFSSTRLPRVSSFNFSYGFSIP